MWTLSRCKLRLSFTYIQGKLESDSSTNTLIYISSPAAFSYPDYVLLTSMALVSAGGVFFLGGELLIK